MLRLNDTLTLLSCSQYTNPKEANAFIPVVYGDMTENSGDVGIWEAPCIDTVNFVYALAAHPIVTALDGNVLRCFDADGVELTAFTATYSGAYEGHDDIAYVTFASDPGPIRVQCKGKTTTGKGFLTNPVDIILDIIGEDATVDDTAFAVMWNVADSLGYSAAGILPTEAKYVDWINAIGASFLMDWYTNGEGELVIRFDTTLTNTIRAAAFLIESEADNITGRQYLKNLANQVIVNYAAIYDRDLRYTVGTRSQYTQTDDGENTKDTLSQGRYGVRTRELSFGWTRNTTTVNTIQERIVEKFAYPLWLIDWTSINYKPAQAEKGDFVVYSWQGRRDDNGDPLVNQFAQIIEKEFDLDKGAIRFLLQEVPNLALTSDPDIWDGNQTAGDGGTFGGSRALEAF